MNCCHPLKALALTFKALNFAHTMYLFVFRIVTYMGDTRRGLGWILDLLTTYTQDSELQALTAPPLISTIHTSPQHPLSLFQPAVSLLAVPW
jgi:hypothetical protein